MPSPWTWDDASKRYRSTETGRYIGQRQMLTMRDFFTEQNKADVDRLTRQLYSTDIKLGRWQLEMQSKIKDVISDQYALSVGGRNNMTQADWGRVGQMTQQQYQKLSEFTEQMRQGMSEGKIKARARMYMNSGTAAYERGNAVSRGVPSLPAYPGDGQTQCLTNCQCHWDLQEGETEWSATWRLGVAEHCPDCVDNAGRWAPLTIPKV